jgi:hypothetical protein
MRKLRLYKLTAEFIVETYPKYKEILMDEFTDAVIDVVEKHNSYICGGFRKLVEIDEDGNEIK